MMLQIAERKMTTDEGLAEMEELVAEIEEHLEGDLPNFESPHFFCRVSENNGKFINDYNYVSWTFTNAHLEYQGGTIAIVLTDDEEFRENIVLHHNRFIARIQKVDFHGFTEALSALINTYNEKSAKKDREIEAFLNFCNLYFKTVKKGSSE